MFDEIGSKIMKLSKILCWLGIIASVIAGVLVIVNTNVSTYSRGYGYGASAPGISPFLAGILIIVVGSLASWIGSLFAYGFGQLIENTDNIRYNSLRRD